MADRTETLARDRSTIMYWLWRMPLIATAQMEVASGFSNNRVHRLLTGLLRDGLVVRCTLAGAGRKQERWWLTSSGIQLVAHERTVRIPWQVTEEGIMWLIIRMPMVEHFYDLALRLWAHDGVITDRPIHMRPDLGPGPIFLAADLELSEFAWFNGGALDAVAGYSNGAWVAMVWVGPETTYHGLLDRAKQAMDVPGATLHLGIGRRLTPAGWVIVGTDRLAAAQAADLWPGDNVLSVTVDGRVERTMRPGDFSLRVQQAVKPCDPGLPERVRRWAQRHPTVQALNDALTYAVCRFVAEWRAATPAQLKRKFGPTYGTAVRALRKRRLIVKLDGGFYLTRRGMRAVADMDGVDYEKVQKRLGVFLNRDGEYRRQQQRHDRALIDVALKLEEEGVPTFAGYRNLLNLPGITQINPDAVLCLERQGGRTLRVNLELEFTARDPGRRQRKLATYEDADLFLKEPTASVWLFEDRRVAQRYAQEGDYLLMMTAVLGEFLAGFSWGPNSVWSLFGKRAPIDRLARIMDVPISEEVVSRQ